MHLMAKYGVEFTFAAPVIKASSNDFAASGDWTPAAGDVKVIKDEAAGANIGTLPNAITTSNNQWKFTLSATEMQAARITISIVDSATKAVEDQAFIVETYGNASAQHAVDLDDIVRAGLTALPNAAADAAGGLPISDAGGLDLDAMNTNVNDIESDLANGTDRLGALKTLIDAIQADLDNGTDGLGAIKTVVDTLATASSLSSVASDVAAILIDTSTTLNNFVDDLEGRIGTPSDLGSGATIAGNLIDIESQTDDIGVAGAGLTAIPEVSADVVKISGSADAADKLERHALEVLAVTFSAGGTTTTAVLNQVDGSAASSTDDVYIGRVLVFNNSTLDHQVAEITDYVGSTKTATISAVTTGPGAGHTAIMI